MTTDYQDYSVQSNPQAPKLGQSMQEETPLESFTVTYRTDDLRRAYSDMNKSRIIWTIIVTVLVLGLLVYEVLRADRLLMGFCGGILLYLMILTVMNFTRLNNLVKRGEKRTMNKEFRYDVYKDYVILTTYMNDEEIAVQRIKFSEMTGVKILGDLYEFCYEDRLFMLHRGDMDEDSRFLEFLRKGSVQ